MVDVLVERAAHRRTLTRIHCLALHTAGFRLRGERATMRRLSRIVCEIGCFSCSVITAAQKVRAGVSECHG